MCPVYVHVLLQILDGIFTYAGVENLGVGTDIEGNPLVKFAMDAVGPGTALVLIKGAAIGLVLYVKATISPAVMLQKIVSRINLLYMLSAAMWAYAFLK
jgi:uncharacterized membrane protein